MTWLFQTWLRLWNYDPNHLAAFGVLGIIAGQATLALPDGRIKTSLLKFFHGAFPSIQMMANGFVGKGSTEIASQIATTILQKMEEAEVKAMQAGTVGGPIGSFPPGPTGPTGNPGIVTLPTEPPKAK